MEPGIYSLKKEFAPALGIPNNQIDRRKEELYEWLKNFFVFEILDGVPIRIHIQEVVGEYQPLPRKYNNEMREKKVAEAKAEYEKYTIKHLPRKYAPTSKSYIARNAIEDFGYDKYNHTNTQYVASTYVKEPFDNNAETNNKSVWVYCSNYEQLNEKTLIRWRQILEEEHISEKEAANAFYRQERGEDISKEKSYYKNAVERFKEEFGEIPVLVKEWRLRRK